MANTEVKPNRSEQTHQSSEQHLQGSPAGHGNQAGAQGELQQSQQGRGLQQQGWQRGSGMSRFSADPFETMQRLSEEMDQLFDSLLYGGRVARPARQARAQNVWAPDLEISEEGNQLRVCVDLPGIPKENVHIDVHDGMLTIQGERREERNEGGEQQGFRRSDRRYGSFCRSISLPEGVDEQNAQARLKEGVLEIVLPIARKESRRLEIQG
jgi:HSP20 family protein